MRKIACANVFWLPRQNNTDVSNINSCRVSLIPDSRALLCMTGGELTNVSSEVENAPRN